MLRHNLLPFVDYRVHCEVFILNDCESVEAELELVVSVHLMSSLFIFSHALRISPFESRGRGPFIHLFFIEEKLKVHNVVLKKEILTQVTFTTLTRWWLVWFHRLVWYSTVLFNSAPLKKKKLLVFIIILITFMSLNINNYNTNSMNCHTFWTDWINWSILSSDLVCLWLLWRLQVRLQTGSGGQKTEKGQTFSREVSVHLSQHESFGKRLMFVFYQPDLFLFLKILFWSLYLFSSSSIIFFSCAGFLL